MTPRDEELVARALLADPALVNRYWKEKRWAELAALVRYARRDVPVELDQVLPPGWRCVLARGLGSQGGEMMAANYRD